MNTQAAAFDLFCAAGSGDQQTLFLLVHRAAQVGQAAGLVPDLLAAQAILATAMFRSQQTQINALAEIVAAHEADRLHDDIAEYLKDK